MRFNAAIFLAAWCALTVSDPRATKPNPQTVVKPAGAVSPARENPRKLTPKKPCCR
jgi:hypothetical protein